MRLDPEQRASRGDAPPSALAVLRAAWGCDCDGKSHRAGGYTPSGPAATAQRHLDVIQSVTGHRPPTCPWRALSDPLVAKTLNLSIGADNNYAMAKLGPNPPAVLLDALDVFIVSRNAGRRHVEKFKEAQNKAKTPKGKGANPTASPGFRSMKRRRRRRG